MSLVVCIRTPNGILMGADSQFSQDDGRKVPSAVKKLVKITHGVDYGFGILGSTSTSQVIQQDILGGNKATLTKFLSGKEPGVRVGKFSREVRRYLLLTCTAEEADNVQLVVCTGGQMYEINQAGFVQSPYEFWATGAGAEFVLGALAIISRVPNWCGEPEQVMREVFDIAFEHNYLISPPVNTQWVK